MDFKDLCFLRPEVSGRVKFAFHFEKLTFLQVEIKIVNDKNS